MGEMTVDKAVKALLKEHSYLQLVEVGEGEQKRLRIRCDLTQHEMLPRQDAIETYLKGKKFLKAKEWYCYDYSKYEPYIVQHRRKPKSLFCNVTSTILNRIPAEVEKHVSGKKFQRLKDHVTFSRGGDDEGDDGEFNANAFEFENQQLIYSDEEEDGEGAPRKKTNGSDDDEDDDNGELEKDEGEDEDAGVEDEVMADFYPKEEDESDQDEHIREAVKRLTVKKRKASAGGSDDESGSESAEAPVPKTKKQKSSSSETKTKSKGRSKEATKYRKHKKGGQ